MVAAGDVAPDFTLPDEAGNTVHLEGERGSWIVLWWYPKASTPG